MFFSNVLFLLLALVELSITFVSCPVYTHIPINHLVFLKEQLLSTKFFTPAFIVVESVVTFPL